MIVTYNDRSDVYWAARVQLNSAEWPYIGPHDDSWIHRPVRDWVMSHMPDSCFTIEGLVLFRRRSDAEWFRLVWEQAP